MNKEKSVGYNGYSQASALSAIYNSNIRCEQLAGNDFSRLSPGRVFSVPSSTPPPLMETLPPHLINWPKRI